MFGFFKKKTTPSFNEIRELLFGDAPLSTFAASLAEFGAAQAALDGGDKATAIAAMRRVLEAPSSESRQKLQAWHVLRELGARPEAEEARRVLGVVLEVHVASGLDTLAGYADHSARCINHGGKLIVWENASDSEMNALVDAALAAGQRIADAIGPWEGTRRPAPPKNHARLNMLTASGLYFGEAPFSVLSADPLAAPLFAAGTNLMQALIDRAGKRTT